MYMDYNYMLSVIIPTKNRAKYCLAAVRQILELDIPDIQIVIQDNSDRPLSDDNDFLLSTANIKYHYNPEVLSFVDNFSKAVSLADGEYLCMIGDDDCILSNIIDAVRYAKQKDIDSVIPSLGSVYVWPSENPIVKNGENGYMCVSYLKRKISPADINKGLSKLLKNGGQFYQSMDLPRLYHGIVRADCVQKIKDKTGTYFGGLTPDIYMSAALAFSCRNTVRLEIPITVSGICPRSGSSDSATGRHTGELRDAPHFTGHESYDWDDRIPYIYTVETIWAETALHAVKDFDQDMADRFDIASLIAILKNKYPQFKAQLNEAVKKYKISAVSIFIKRLYYKFLPYVKRCFLRFTGGKKPVFKKYGVPDISAAAKETEKIIAQKGLKVFE